MSYEGYTNYFCSNGHYLGSADVYEDSEIFHCYCGAEKVFQEAVDQTNGCCCDDGSCCAHSQVLQKALRRMDDSPCQCKNGKVMITKSYKTGEQVEVDCPKCKGTSKVQIPVYDISSIDYRNRG